MLAIVRVALNKPYTFVVMAMLIVIFGVTAAIKTPTDIFPNIGIPVVAVVWTYNGLPPDDMSGRVIYYYERTLSAQVNDIEHIESQSLAGYGVVKVFFQPNVNINSALAQITAASQTVLKLLPPGITPPYVLSFSASSVPILQLALSSDTLSQAEIFDAGQNFIRPQLATVAGAAVPSPYGGKVLQVQVDLNQDKLQAYGLSSQDVVDAIARQNVITPVGTEKVGTFEYVVALNDAPSRIAELNDLPIRTVDGVPVYIHDVAYVHEGSPPQTNMVRVDGSNAVLMTILKTGSASTLDVIAGVKALLPKLRETLPSSLRLEAVGDQSTFVKAAVSSVIFEGVGRRGADRADDPDLSRQLAFDRHHYDLDSAGDSDLGRAPGRNRRDDQRHDARRPCARGRHSRRRRDGDDREHQLPPRAGQGHRKRDHGRRAADRHSRDRLASVHLHRVRADVHPRRGRRLPVSPDGESGRFRPDRLLCALAHPGQHDGALSARSSGERTAMARPCRRRAIRSLFSSADSNGASKPRARSIGACS